MSTPPSSAAASASSAVPCYHPLQGYRSRTTNASGKRSIVFDTRRGYIDLPVTVPCNQCIGCRLERSRQWAIRCTHEAQLHEDNSFITLTYSDEHLPGDGSLKVADFQDFMKRLRFEHRPKRIRFFHCGEYGELNFRPHYHACLFGLDFPDRRLHITKNDVPLYTSATLAKSWKLGFSTVGDVTFQSAAYVARYIMKKLTGDAADELVAGSPLKHYEALDPDTGEIHILQPEYTTMSRKPGIGADWYAKFHTDVYPSDEVIVNAKPIRPPKFYDGRLELQDPQLLQRIKKRRLRAAHQHEADQTPERLAVREQVKLAQINQLKRDLS